MDEKIADAIWRASALICQKRYIEARIVLSGIDHPAAKDWVTMLDKKLSRRMVRTPYLAPAYSAHSA